MPDNKKQDLLTSTSWLDLQTTRPILFGLFLMLIASISMISNNGFVGILIGYFPVYLFGAGYILLAMVVLVFGLLYLIKKTINFKISRISKLAAFGMFLSFLILLSPHDLSLNQVSSFYQTSFSNLTEINVITTISSSINGGWIGYVVYTILRSIFGATLTQLIAILGVFGCGFFVMRPLLYSLGNQVIQRAKGKDIKRKITPISEDDDEVLMTMEERLARIKVEDHQLRHSPSFNKLFIRQEDIKPTQSYSSTGKDIDYMPFSQSSSSTRFQDNPRSFSPPIQEENFNVFKDPVFKAKSEEASPNQEKKIGREKIFFDFSSNLGQNEKQNKEFTPSTSSTHSEAQTRFSPLEFSDISTTQTTMLKEKQTTFFEEQVESIATPIEVVQVNEHRIQRPTPFKRVVEEEVKATYRFPTIDLLKQESINRVSAARSEAEHRATLLDQKLETFGVDAWVKNYIIAPAFTRFEIELGQLAKMHQFNTIKNDIMGALFAERINILTPIPGSQYVGVEIPNKERSTVSFKEVMNEIPYEAKDKKLLVALGKNIVGNVISTELNKAPHMLIAGQTGSGKSVCINSIIVSLLMRCHPDEVKLMLIDPKRVELSIYAQVPHLLCPVISDPKRAAVALSYLVDEITDRFKVFETGGFKMIDSYNEYARQNNLKPYPYIVTIIDELADLMMIATKSVEDSIRRITAIARAAGVHLIVATQRPSVDVITGVIKANIPTRIAFAVSSGVDSRTILDEVGAEELLGSGDMLFRHPSFRVLERIQGAFVSDEDIEAIVYHVKAQAQPKYDERFLNLDPVQEQLSLQDSLGYSADNEDSYYQDILQQCSNWDTISASYLQRKFSIGYQRASRIIDRLESDGFVGPVNGSKPREIYRSKIEEYLENEN